MKRCSKCGDRKSVKEFYKNRSRVDGLSTWCRDCTKASQAIYAKTEKRKEVLGKYNVSDKRRKRQRVYDASDKGRGSHRRWRDSDAGKAYQAEQRESVEHRVRMETNQAIRRGDLVRQPCEVCGRDPAEAHHDDYSEPLKVRWLCAKHHRALHREAA